MRQRIPPPSGHQRVEAARGAAAHGSPASGERAQAIGDDPRRAADDLRSAGIQHSPYVALQRARIGRAFGDAVQPRNHRVVQRVRRIRVGSKVRVNLAAAGAGLTATEAATVIGVVDDDTYLVQLTAYKHQAKGDAFQRRQVDQALVEPADRKQFEEDRCIDIAKSAKNPDDAVMMLANWSDVAGTIPIQVLAAPVQLSLVMRGFGEADAKLFAAVMLRVYEDPRLQPLLTSLGGIQSTALHPAGQTHHTLASFAEVQLGMLGKLGYAPGRGMAGLSAGKILEMGRGVDADRVSKAVKAESLAGLPLLALSNVCPAHDSREWEILGRTVIFHPCKEDQGHVAVKLAKKDEDLDELYKEGGMQRILNMAKRIRGDKTGRYVAQARELGLDPQALANLDLRSTFPEPVGVFMIEMPTAFSDGARVGVSKGIEEQFARQSGRNIYPCFVYRTDDYQYFQYINRATDRRKTQQGSTTERGLPIPEMQMGTGAAMHDIFATAGQSWMFTQLIDLYHHNSLGEAKASDDLRTQLLRTGDDRVADGGGRFLVLLDLLRKVGRDRGPAAPTWGMGRVDNVTGAVGYPNVRKTGVADVGDARSLDELLGKVKELQAWMASAKGQGTIADTGSPWKQALSPEVAKLDPKRARSIGFIKPDLDLAKEVGAAMRRFDAAIRKAVDTGLLPSKDQCGFTNEELKKGLSRPLPPTTDGVSLAAGRALVKLSLMSTCGLDEKSASHLAMVDDAYDALYDASRDKPSSGLEDRALKRKAEMAKVNLAFVEGTRSHQQQTEAHELFGDVKHLLVPAEQEGGGVTPYVMSAYLSEYFISHLLLTGTYFCKDVKVAADLKRELAMGASTPMDRTPVMQSLRQTLLGGCADAVVGFCGLPSDQLAPLMTILEGFADFTKLARQVAFFMTDAYAPVLLPGGTVQHGTKIDTAAANEEDTRARAEMVRLGVFAADDRVDIDDPTDHRMRDAYFNSSWGQKGGPGTGPDLGTYNGQMPVKEFEALAYRIVPYLMFKQMATRK